MVLKKNWYSTAKRCKYAEKNGCAELDMNCGNSEKDSVGEENQEGILSRSFVNLAVRVRKRSITITFAVKTQHIDKSE